MKTTTYLKWLIMLLFITNTKTLLAQSKTAVFDEKTPITWLGIDFSQTKFIGIHVADYGVITNDQFRDNYAVAWNQLFIDEPKKFDVAKAMHRPTVKNAIDVTGTANKELKKEFFVENPADVKLLNEATIIDLVKGYDFKNNDGIGIMFFVDKMSKGEQIVTLWVAFVDMKTKTLLFTANLNEKVGGFGFRNYYAKAFYSALKDIDSNFSTWKKQLEYKK